MKLFLILIAGLISVSCGSRNLPDSRDANLVPAAQEERENEVYNLPDAIDENTVPAAQEERAREEEGIYDYDGMYE